MVDIKTYILHCKSLSERFDWMSRQLEYHGIDDVVWYTDDDASDQSGQDLTGIYNGLNEDSFRSKIKIGGWNVNHHRPRLLTPGETSLATKWGKVLKKISEGSDEIGLVLEDDAILCDGFKNLFFDYLKNTPDDWDVIYLGDGAGLHAKDVVEGKTAYKVPHPASRCTDSILFKKESARKISDIYFPFDLGSDFELGYVQSKLGLNVYWWEPTLVTQASEHGIFKSSLR